MSSIVIDGNQKSNLNSTQLTNARCYFSSILNGKEYFCGLNSDNNRGCNKTISELTTLWEANQITKAKKICSCGWQQTGIQSMDKPFRVCPQCSGERRVEILLFLNEKLGSGLHRYVDDVYEPFGNVCLYCKSCQMIWDKKRNQNDLTPVDKDKAEYTTRKSKEVRINLPNDIKDELALSNNLCYGMVVNHWTTKYKCSQKLIEQSIKAWLDRSDGFFLVNKTEYKFDCDLNVCTGEHLILARDLLDHKLVPHKSNYQTMIDSELELHEHEQSISNDQNNYE